MKSDATTLVAEAAACRLCAAHLPHGPRPVFQFDPAARILIAGQAPGARVHASGKPFDDPSGERLRDWLGIDRATFYDRQRMAILPMGFCFPGSGPHGDLPPRPECAATWRQRFIDALPQLELVVILGRHALAWHLPGERRGLTDVVRDWRRHWPGMILLPHPSPRNNRWLAANPWFAETVVPVLQARVRVVLEGQ
ncbi:MAG: uracil-DNA glycosylase family protein [Rhodocyclaceae bacterium]|nr:uracil-DNA glycosylase family protein [Rhodocyclaceae bacterium]